MLKILLIVTLLLHAPAALAPPSRSAGVSWSWSNPLPQGNALAGITCRRGSCLAVGAGGTVLRTTDDGRSWRTEHTGTTADLKAATCTGSYLCVVAGAFGTILTSHNGGSTWTHHQLPRIYHFRSLSCPDGHTCYALAQDVRWDCMSTPCDVLGKDNALLVTNDGGRRWTRVNAGRITNLSGIVCPTRLECVSFSRFSALVQKTRNGGKSWQRVNGVPAASVPQAASCPTSRRCYLLAADRLLRGVDPVLFLSSDSGATWRRLELPPSLAHLSGWQDLACPSVATCYVTGGDAILVTHDAGAKWVPSQEDPQTPLSRLACESNLICHILAASSAIVTTTDGGGTWRDDVQGPQPDLMRLSCPGSGVCYALARDGSFLSHSVTTGRWTVESTPLPPEIDASYRPGLSCPDSTTCFAAGAYATIVRTDNGGASWRPQSNPFSGTAINFQGVACPNASTCYAIGFGCLRVGCNGQEVAAVVGTTDGGAAWRTLFRTTPRDFNLPPGMLLFEAIACPTVAHCIVTGSPALILVTWDSGKTWKRIQSVVSNTNADLVGVTCAGNQTCYAVGWGCPALGCLVDFFTSTVLRSDDGGSTWEQETSNSTTEVEGFLCGPRGICASGTPLTSISCTNPRHCWAAGGGLSQGDGTVLATADGGRSWERERTPSGNALLAIDCPASGRCFAAGAGGTILRRSG